MNVDQTDFTAAILNPDMAVPEGLVGPNDRPAGARFSVYRNNVAVSLTEALQAAFPCIQKLVGEEFFRAMAGVYLRTHPPKSPLMMFYGEDMPDFLSGFQPVQHLGFLPDVARLELAMRQSYHAADADAFDANVLAQMDAEVLMAATFAFAPATKLVRSDWPLFDIWTANMAGGPKPAAVAQSVLVARAEFDPAPIVLTTPQAVCLTALMKGEALGEAIASAGDDFDLTPLLGILLSSGALTNKKKGS